MRQREPAALFRITFVFAVLAVAFPPAFGDATYSIQQIGLSNPVYSGQSAIALNAVGDVGGEAGRQGAGNVFLGRDEWDFNGITTQQVGLIGTNYSYSFDGGLYEYTGIQNGADTPSPLILNNQGQFIGFSNRYTASGVSLGQDAWVFNATTTQQIGLTGTGYSYSATGGTYEFSDAIELNNLGEIAGTSNIYSSNGGNLGSTAWIFNGTTIQPLGFTGSVYTSTIQGLTHQSSSFPEVGSIQEGVLNNAGQAIGTSTRYKNNVTNGTDAWIWNGTSLTQIGLTGVGFTSTGTVPYESSSPVALSDNGFVIGTSLDVTSNGTTQGDDAWIYNGSSTNLIGLTGPAYTFTGAVGNTYHEAAVSLVNDSGQAAGLSYLASNPENDSCWLFNGSTTQAIGLTGSIYSSSAPQYLNNTGYVVGLSQRSNFQYLGQDAWIFNGTTTIQIGLTGPRYGYQDGSFGIQETSVPTGLNDAGQVIGYSLNQGPDGGGQDGWFYDSSANTTDLLQFSVDSATGYSYTDPEVLTANGDVFGQYTLYSGSTLIGNRGFFWSPSGGLEDLGSLVDGGLSAVGWQDLADAYLAWDTGSGANLPAFIVGSGDLLAPPAGKRSI